jgi:AhpD family alkylhydroperoxidase
MIRFTHLTLIASALAVASVAAAEPPTALRVASPPSAETAATFADIEQTLGVVPAFFRTFPPSALPGAWLEMKMLQGNPATALSPKEKELIGLAVSAQIPCDYCTYYHTEMAQLAGATVAELDAAVAEAALVRHWSTFVNGIDADEATFRGEVDRMLDHASQATAMPLPAAARPATTAAEALADIQATFGFVPGFLAAFPPEALPGAWRQMKALELSPDAPLPGKLRDLIGMAVAAQVPCGYCTYFHGQSARRLEGVTEREIAEAVAMASIVRHWSTVLNGRQVDEAQFRADVDRIVKTCRAMQAAPAAAGTH